MTYGKQNINSDVLNPYTDGFYLICMLGMFEVKMYEVVIGSYSHSFVYNTQL